MPWGHYSQAGTIVRVNNMEDTHGDFGAIWLEQHESYLDYYVDTTRNPHRLRRIDERPENRQKIDRKSTEKSKSVLEKLQFWKR